MFCRVRQVAAPGTKLQACCHIATQNNVSRTKPYWCCSFGSIRRSKWSKRGSEQPSKCNWLFCVPRRIDFQNFIKISPKILRNPAVRKTIKYTEQLRAFHELRTANVTTAEVGVIARKQEAQLPQRTARCCMLVGRRSCYVSRGMTVRKAFISKNNLQGHSRALTVVSFDRVHTISY